MRSVKLSLVAAMAAGSFSALGATPLEEAIRGVDISGAAWYRYESGRYTPGSAYTLNAAGGVGTFSQTHRFKGWLNTKIRVGDGFTVFGQFMYWSNVNDGYGTAGTNANTKEPILLRLAGIEYFNPDASNLKISLGRQVLGTIWSDDMAGMAAKFSVQPEEGVTVSAFVVDSFETNDSDKADVSKYKLTKTTLTNFPTASNNAVFGQNLYGAAVLTDFGPAKLQIWGAYWNDVATLYALKFNFGTRFGDMDQNGFKLNVEYLGNTVNGVLKDATSDFVDNGNLVHGRATLNLAGFDVYLGGAFYGKKGKITINTLEEGKIGTDGNTYFGKEITYQRGSWIAMSAGQNAFGYVGAGYRIVPEFRFGLQGVFGATSVKDGTITAQNAAELGGGKKYELVAEADYRFNNKLDFLIYYSYLNTSAKDGITKNGKLEKADSSKNTVRFQARYKF